MLKHVNGNIQAFNEKYLERLLITPTLPNDSLIVPRVEEDMAPILDHAHILYKIYAGSRANGSSSGYVSGWRPVSYKCKYCDSKATKSYENFVKHLEVCEGLDD